MIIEPRLGSLDRCENLQVFGIVYRLVVVDVNPNCPWVRENPSRAVKQLATAVLSRLRRFRRGLLDTLKVGYVKRDGCLAIGKLNTHRGCASR